MRLVTGLQALSGLLLLHLSLSVAAATSPVIDPTVAGLYVGQQVNIEAAVTATERDGNVVHLRLGNPPQQVSVALIEGLLSNFPKAPEQFYAGKTVRVAGMLQEFRGALEIRLLNADDIQVFEPGQPRPGSAAPAAAAAPPPAPAPAAPVAAAPVAAAPVAVAPAVGAAPGAAAAPVVVPANGADQEKMRQLEERIRQLEAGPPTAAATPTVPAATATAVPPTATEPPPLATATLPLPTATAVVVPTPVVEVAPLAAPSDRSGPSLEALEERLRKMEIRVRQLEHELHKDR